MVFFTLSSLAVLASLAASIPAARADNVPDGSILEYYPSEMSAIIIGSLFAAVAVLLQVRLHISKPRIWYGTTLSIAAVASAAGWYTRIALRDDMTSLGMYIITTLLVILPPASIIAFSYITYGRVIIAVDPSCAGAGKRTAKSHYSFIPPRLVTIFFLTSDISTFCIQAVGGSLQAETDKDLSDAGNWTFLVGVSLQGASYFLFSVLTIFAWFRLRKLDPAAFRFWALRTSNSQLHPSVPIFQTIAATSIFIIIRSVFRIVEMAEGFGGTLMSSEAYLIILDAVPILITSVLWAIFWPAKALEDTRISGAPRPAAASADTDLEAGALKNNSLPMYGNETPLSTRSMSSRVPVSGSRSSDGSATPRS